MPRMLKIVAVFAVGCLALSVLVIAGEESATSPTVYQDTYGEKTERTGVYVATRIAHWSKEKDPFFPLQVGVAVYDTGPELHFVYGSFVLTDEAGNKYMTVPPSEVIKDRHVWGGSRRYAQESPMKLAAVIREDSKAVDSLFYNKDGTEFGGVFLPGPTHFQDVIFFPRPKDGLGQVLALHVNTEGMKSPIAVRFEVPDQK